MKPSTIIIVCTLAITHQWIIQQIDVNNTFLNGDLQEIVCMAQLEGFVDQGKPTLVCKLVKALCGWSRFSIVQNLKPKLHSNSSQENQRKSPYDFCSTPGIILKDWFMEIVKLGLKDCLFFFFLNS